MNYPYGIGDKKNLLSKDGTPPVFSFREALASPVSAYVGVQHIVDENLDIQLTKILLDHKQSRHQQAIKRYENLITTLGFDKDKAIIDQSDHLDENQASLLIFELLFMLKSDANPSEKQLWKYIDSVGFFNPDDVICQGGIYNLLLVLFLRRNNIGAAFEMAKLALNAYQRCESNYLQLFVHLHMAFIHVYAGRLNEAKHALDNAHNHLIKCGTPVCENAMIEITRHWVIAEASSVFPDPDQLAPLGEEIISGEFWPETFLVLVALQFRAAIRQGDVNVLEQHSGYEAMLRARGLVQLLPAMQLLRQEFLLEEKNPSANKPGNLPERQVVLLLPTTNTWQLNVGESPVQTPTLCRIRALDDMYQAKQWHNRGRFDIVMKHFMRAVKAIEDQGWLFLLESEHEFISNICKECKQRKRYVHFARRLQNTMLTRQTPQNKDLNNGAILGFTVSEVGVLSRLSEATSNKAIALDLGVSESTIKYHLKNIYRKLSVHSRRDAIRVALTKGLIAAGSRVMT
ncbi:MAG: LuxR C-terminal-related transcriptional regulator [Devosiaceae bacterium]|nr:LuxR C-terminal-related transcriptional regulator [Devosiaceae bacterium]